MGLGWAEVDLDAATVVVRQTRTAVADPSGHGTRVIIGPPKSGHGRRVDIDGPTVAALRAWRRVQAAERLALGALWPEGDWVFTSEDGQPVHPETLSGVFDRVAARTDLPRITLHGLRHSHGTVLLAAGQPLAVVSERLGHRSQTTTLAYYSHVLAGQQAQAASVFAAAVGGA